MAAAAPLREEPAVSLAAANREEQSAVDSQQLRSPRRETLFPPASRPGGAASASPTALAASPSPHFPASLSQSPSLPHVGGEGAMQLVAAAMSSAALLAVEATVAARESLNAAALRVDRSPGGGGGPDPVPQTPEADATKLRFSASASSPSPLSSQSPAAPRASAAPPCASSAALQTCAAPSPSAASAAAPVSPVRASALGARSESPAAHAVLQAADSSPLSTEPAGLLNRVSQWTGMRGFWREETQAETPPEAVEPSANAPTAVAARAATASVSAAARAATSWSHWLTEAAGGLVEELKAEVDVSEDLKELYGTLARDSQRWIEKHQTVFAHGASPPASSASPGSASSFSSRVPSTPPSPPPASTPPGEVRLAAPASSAGAAAASSQSVSQLAFLFPSSLTSSTSAVEDVQAPSPLRHAQTLPVMYSASSAASRLSPSALTAASSPMQPLRSRPFADDSDVWSRLARDDGTLAAARTAAAAMKSVSSGFSSLFSSASSLVSSASDAVKSTGWSGSAALSDPRDSEPGRLPQRPTERRALRGAAGGSLATWIQEAGGRRSDARQATTQNVRERLPSSIARGSRELQRQYAALVRSRATFLEDVCESLAPAGETRARLELSSDVPEDFSLLEHALSPSSANRDDADALAREFENFSVEAYDDLLDFFHDPAVMEMRRQLVPDAVSDALFWRRFLFRVRALLRATAESSPASSFLACEVEKRDPREGSSGFEAPSGGPPSDARWMAGAAAAGGDRSEESKVRLTELDEEDIAWDDDDAEGGAGEAEGSSDSLHLQLSVATASAEFASGAMMRPLPGSSRGMTPRAALLVDLPSSSSPSPSSSSASSPPPPFCQFPEGHPAAFSASSSEPQRVDATRPEALASRPPHAPPSAAAALFSCKVALGQEDEEAEEVLSSWQHSGLSSRSGEPEDLGCSSSRLGADESQQPPPREPLQEGSAELFLLPGAGRRDAGAESGPRADAGDEEEVALEEGWNDEELILL